MAIHGPRLRYQDYHLENKLNKKLDVVIVKVSVITEEGGIIFGAVIGAIPLLIQWAD